MNKPKAIAKEMQGINEEDKNFEVVEEEYTKKKKDKTYVPGAKKPYVKR